MHLYILAGTEEVSPQASSRDSQTGQGALSQQQQQPNNSMETYRQSYLSSGKFNGNFNFIRLTLLLHSAHIHLR